MDRVSVLVRLTEGKRPRYAMGSVNAQEFLDAQEGSTEKDVRVKWNDKDFPDDDIVVDNIRAYDKTPPGKLVRNKRSADDGWYICRTKDDLMKVSWIFNPSVGPHTLPLVSHPRTRYPPALAPSHTLPLLSHPHAIAHPSAPIASWCAHPHQTLFARTIAFQTTAPPLPPSLPHSHEHCSHHFTLHHLAPGCALLSRTLTVAPSQSHPPLTCSSHPGTPAHCRAPRAR